MIKKKNLKERFPELIKQWHPTKNVKLVPENFTPSSGVKVWWKCKEGEDHEWKTSISKRTRKIKPTKCPFCSGSKPSKNHNLKSKFPELIKQWHPTKNVKLVPENFTPSSGFKVWWKCKEGEDHEWESIISNRTKILNPRGCPFCSGHKPSKKYNLSFIFPSIAKELHPTKNGKIKPENITPNARTNLWWKCQNNHVWKAGVYTRARGHGCPKCTHQTSMPEIRIFTELLYLFSNDIFPRYKIGNKEIDIYIKSLFIGIEYDGSYFHKDKLLQDKAKNIFFKNHGIEIIRIREFPLKSLSLNDVEVKGTLNKKSINKIIEKIEILKPNITINNIDEYKKNKNFMNQSIFQTYMSYFPSPFPEKSLLNLHPKISEQWNYDKNFPLKPENFSEQSSTKVWWKCKKGEDHEWEAIISSRTRMTQPTKCPFCSGKKPSQNYNFLKFFPEISKEWHPQKNGNLKPEFFTPNSGKKIWWQCLIDQKHEWETQIDVRAKGHGCQNAGLNMLLRNMLKTILQNYFLI